MSVRQRPAAAAAAAAKQSQRVQQGPGTGKGKSVRDKVVFDKIPLFYLEHGHVTCMSMLGDWCYVGSSTGYLYLYKLTRGSLSEGSGTTTVPSTHTHSGGKDGGNGGRNTTPGKHDHGRGEKAAGTDNTLSGGISFGYDSNKAYVRSNIIFKVDCVYKIEVMTHEMQCDQDFIHSKFHGPGSAAECRLPHQSTCPPSAAAAAASSSSMPAFTLPHSRVFEDVFLDYEKGNDGDSSSRSQSRSISRPRSRGSSVEAASAASAPYHHTHFSAEQHDRPFMMSSSSSSSSSPSGRRRSRRRR